MKESHKVSGTSIRASLFANSSSSLLVTDDESAVDSIIFGVEMTEADSDPTVDLASLEFRASLSLDSMDLSFACKL
jgi:hypothetical protein